MVLLAKEQLSQNSKKALEKDEGSKKSQDLSDSTRQVTELTQHVSTGKIPVKSRTNTQKEINTETIKAWPEALQRAMGTEDDAYGLTLCKSVLDTYASDTQEYVLAYVLRICCAARLGKAKEAQIWLEQVHVTMIKHRDTLYWLSMAYSLLGKSGQLPALYNEVMAFVWKLWSANGTSRDTASLDQGLSVQRQISTKVSQKFDKSNQENRNSESKQNGETVIHSTSEITQKTLEDITCVAIQRFVRWRRWQNAHALALKLSKMEDHYFYWAVIFLMLQVQESVNKTSQRELLSKIGLRLLNTERHDQREECLGLIAEAYRVFGNPVQALKSLECWAEGDASSKAETYSRLGLGSQELLISLWKENNSWEDIWQFAKFQIEQVTSPETQDQNRNANYAHFTLLVQAAQRLNRQAEARLLLQKADTRPFALARLDLAAAEGKPLSLTQYIETFAHLRVCFTDLLPYLQHGTTLDLAPPPITDADSLTRSVNIHKIMLKLDAQTLTQDVLNGQIVNKCNNGEAASKPPSHTSTASNASEEFMSRGLNYLSLYLDSHKHSADGAVDFVFLAVQSFTLAHHHSKERKPLYLAICALKLLLRANSDQTIARLYLVRLYRLLAAPSLALDQWTRIGVKSLMHDTLSHWCFQRASTYSLGANNDLSLLSHLRGELDGQDSKTTLWKSNEVDTQDSILQAIVNNNFSVVLPLDQLYNRIKNSIERDSTIIEEVRIKFNHEITSVDEVRPIYDALDQQTGVTDPHSAPKKHDQRDFDVIENLMPVGCPTFEILTALGPRIEQQWLCEFTKVYMRILNPDNIEVGALKEHTHQQVSMTEAEGNLCDISLILLSTASAGSDVLKEQIHALQNLLTKFQSLYNSCDWSIELPWRSAHIIQVTHEAWNIIYHVYTRIRSDRPDVESHWRLMLESSQNLLREMTKHSVGIMSDRRTQERKQIVSDCQVIASLRPGCLSEDGLHTMATEIVNDQTTLFEGLAEGIDRRMGQVEI